MTKMNKASAFKAPNARIIDVSEQNELTYWSDKLGIRPEVLKSAIRASRSNTLGHIVDYLKSNNKIDADYTH
jgi:hypothetical protein